MDFNSIKKLIIVFIVFIAGNFIYNKYIKIGCDTVKVDLRKICLNTKSSLFVVIFKDRNVTVIDRNNTLKYMLLNKDDLANKLFIDCNEHRKTLTLETGVILKTQNDSIDIEPTYEKIHGYMGVLEKNNCYQVNYKNRFEVYPKTKRADCQK